MIDMSVAYIAGPISGVKDYKQRFARAGRYLRQMGFDVILNPAEVLPEEIEPKQALPICLRMIESSDIIFFMPDWSKSPGANIERLYAAYLDKQIEYLPDNDKKRRKPL